MVTLSVAATSVVAWQLSTRAAIHRVRQKPEPPVVMLLQPPPPPPRLPIYARYVSSGPDCGNRAVEVIAVFHDLGIERDVRVLVPCSAARPPTILMPGRDYVLTVTGNDDLWRAVRIEEPESYGSASPIGASISARSTRRARSTPTCTATPQMNPAP
jgi:hypothetical protein